MANDHGDGFLTVGGVTSRRAFNCWARILFEIQIVSDPQQLIRPCMETLSFINEFLILLINNALWVFR